MSDRDNNLMNTNTSTMFDNNNNNNNTASSFATAFKGRNTAMSTDDLRKARESRAADALRMKDEQLKILSEQNGNLLLSLDKVTTFTILLKLISFKYSAVCFDNYFITFSLMMMMM